jgi:hypothetical protein
VISGKLVLVKTVVNLNVGRSSSGSPAFEQVLVEARGTDRYVLLASPGLALGVAAGDEIMVDDGGRYRVLTRGGNLCVQVFRNASISDVDRFATGRVIQLRGWLDGKAAKELVYTIPVSAGFPAIEGLFSEVKVAYPDVEWYFGNVYDERDGVTPLNWWLAETPAQG